MKAARVALWEWDLTNGTLTFLNSYETLYGIAGTSGPLSSDQAMGLVHPDDHISVLAAADRAIRTGEDFHCEFRGPAANEDGSPRWFASHGHFEVESDELPRRILGITWEITDRVRTEQALRRSEAEARKLSMVASRTHNAVILTDAKGCIEWVNAGFTRLTGYDLHEVLGKSPGAVLQGPESDPKTRRRMRAAVRNGKGFEAEIVNYHKSGRCYWVAIEVRPIYDETGRLTHYMAIESDVSERRRAEQALQQLNEELERRVEHRTRQLLNLNADLRVQIAERAQVESSLRASEQRFREIAETIHEVFWIAAPDFGRILYVSPGYERVWGRSCDGLYATPRSLLEAIHPDDGEIAAAILDRRRQGRLVDCEYRIVHSDCEIRWVWNRGFPIRGDDGSIVRYVDVALDITDRKAIEKALQTHSEVLFAMSETVSFIDEHGLIRFTNPAFDAMFGYKPDELIGRPVSVCSAATPEENQRIMSEVMDAVASKRVWAGEFRNVKKDGTLFWTAAHISQVSNDGDIRFVSIQQDITERKRSDEQLAMLKTQLAHASRLGTLGEMSAGLAHELNQPLAAVCLFASAARDIGLSLDSPQLDHCLTQIDEQALRAAEIIRRMRAFASRQPFHRESADINQLLREVVAILENELRHARVETDLRLAAELPAISVDRIQIQQLVVNLIRNAIEAMSHQGSREKLLTVASEVDACGIRVSISDNGEGLSPEIADTLFAPFHSTKPSGLGLGLAICRTLVEAHGGSIDVRSSDTRGATFYFVLPCSSIDRTESAPLRNER